MDPSSMLGSAINNEHRREFNLAAFGTTFGPGDLPAASSKARRKVYPKKRYDEIVKRLRYWDVVDGHIDPVTGRHVTQKQLKKSCEPSWWEDRFKYRLEFLVTGDGIPPTEHLQRHCGRKELWLIVVHQEMVFDAIHACHVAARHKKAGSTWNVAKETYYNLTEDLVRIFVATCPLCKCPDKNCRVVQSPPLIGSQFRDKFTACVVDYSANPVRDKNSVTMKFLLVLQDEVTGFTVLRRILRLDKSNLKYELRYMFATLGFPKMVFKRDEESELRYYMVTQIIERAEPQCRFEDVKLDGLILHVKNVISRLQKQCADGDESEDEDDLRRSNWVTLIPKAMIELNKESYRKVFGMDYSSRTNGMACSATDTQPIMPMPVDNQFSACREVAVESELSKSRQDRNQDLDVLSILDSLDSPPPTPPIENQSPKVANTADEEQYDILEALKRSNCDVINVAETTYRVAYPKLQCATCDIMTVLGPQALSIAVESYYDCFASGTRWWTTSMINAFGILKLHDAHRSNIIYIDSSTPTPKESLQRSSYKIQKLPESVESIVTLGLKNRHFVVLQMKLKPHYTIVVYDGKSSGSNINPEDVRQWEDHCEYVLWRYGLTNKQCGVNWYMRYYDKFRDSKRGVDSKLDIQQDDNYNCGPIACRVLWELLCPGEFDQKHGTSGRLGVLKASDDVDIWRKICIDELMRLVNKYSRELLIKKKPRKRHMLQQIANKERVDAESEAKVPRLSAEINRKRGVMAGKHPTW